MKQNVFWPLVRHELNRVGDRRKMAKKQRYSKKWALVYFITMAILAIAFIIFLSYQKGYELQNVWFFTLGLPYMIFFFSFGIVKREWSNQTQGWWLALPYSRNQLISAKYIASLFQMLLIYAAVFVLGAILGLLLTVIQTKFSNADLGTYFVIGTAWLEILISITPIILAFGMFTATVQYTSLRPLMPILWFIFMGLGSFIYWGIGFTYQHDNNLFAQFAGDEKMSLFPFSGMFLVVILLSWILAYVILKISAYLLDKKLMM